MTKVLVGLMYTRVSN